MSSSAAEHLKLSAKSNTGVLSQVNVQRMALAAGMASLPLGVFALTTNNWLLLSVSAIASGAAALAYAHATLKAGKVQRTHNEMRADAFGHLVEHVRDAVLQFSASGELVLASKSSQDLFGCPKYELTGSGLADRTHVLDRPLYMTAFADAHNDGKERLVEVRMRRDEMVTGQVAPEYAWIELNLSPIKLADNKAGPFGVIALMRDITRRKESENHMIEAQKAAEEASLAKSQFLAVIGHELRTPLNAIVGFSDMMANGIGGELEATHAEYVGLISQSGHHLIEVVNMLLDMSKIEAGRFELQAQNFEPESLVAPCIQMVSKSAQEKNVEIEVKLGKQLPEIIGDERACRQILINLLSNAIKFSKPGSCVTWSMKRQGQSLSLTVSDAGIGMSEGVLARLGEPFFQAQSSADRRYEGTGLGMSIVKGLVDLHEGSISVNSTPGQGTTVSVLLPIDGPKGKKDGENSITQLHPDENTTQREQWSEPRRMA